MCVRVCFVSTSCADLKQIAAQQQQQARASSKLTYFARLQLVWFARRVQTASKLESASESVFSLSPSLAVRECVCVCWLLICAVALLLFALQFFALGWAQRWLSRARSLTPPSLSLTAAWVALRFGLSQHSWLSGAVRVTPMLPMRLYANTRTHTHTQIQQARQMCKGGGNSAVYFSFRCLLAN